jgi:hypothetical protein
MLVVLYGCADKQQPLSKVHELAWKHVPLERGIIGPWWLDSNDPVSQWVFESNGRLYNPDLDQYFKYGTVGDTLFMSYYSEHDPYLFKWDDSGSAHLFRLNHEEGLPDTIRIFRWYPPDPEDTVLDRLQGFREVLERFDEKFAKDSVKSVVYTESDSDDPNAIHAVRQGFYHVYVGESHRDHNVRWYTFLLSSDFKRILFYDEAQSREWPPEHWRDVWPATEFLKRE